MLYKNEAWMLQKYEIEELSPRKMAPLANCDPSTVFVWLRKFGIYIRTNSEAKRGKHPSTKSREKMSKAHRGEKNHNYGKHPSDDTRQKISEAQRGEKNNNYGKHHSEKTKQKMSDAHIGENHPNWQGGKSFEPYCHKFNRPKKEEIRDKYGRKCFICGAEENGKRHAVHHLDYNKMQGCETKDWNLLPLCTRCHAKTNFNRWYWFSLLFNHWAMNPEINFRMGEKIWL